MAATLLEQADGGTSQVSCQKGARMPLPSREWEASDKFVCHGDCRQILDWTNFNEDLSL